MSTSNFMQIAQTLTASELLGQLAYENAAMIDSVELLGNGSFRLVVGTYDDTPLNEASILEKLEQVQGLRIGAIHFYEKLKGCAPGGGGCPTSGKEGGCGTSGGCGSGGCSR